MTKKSTADYWRKREERWQKEYEQNLEYWQRQIWTIYRNLKEDMQAEIDAWYSRFATAEGISDAEAKRRISRADQDFYARRAKQLVEMAQKDMQAGTNRNADKYFSDAANADMRIYNATMKINRMQLLESMLDLEIDVATDKINRSMAEGLEQQARKTYLNQSKILGDTVIQNMERLPALVNASFHGASFSDRIWGGHQQKLKDEMQRILARGLILGEHPDRFRKLIVSQTDLKTRSAYKAAGRLLNTEFARVQTSAQLDSIKTAGFEQFMFITAPGCCPHCQANDGKTFDSRGSMAGENLPPMHPICRCTVAPYSDRKEYEEWLDGYSEHGMDWEEWQEEQSINKDFQVHKSVGAAGWNYSVKLLNGKKTKIVPGTKVTKIVCFAGKGKKTPIRERFGLEKKYSLPAEDWKKMRGTGYVFDENGNKAKAELHWYECYDKKTKRIERHKMKVKRYYDE